MWYLPRRYEVVVRSSSGYPLEASTAVKYGVFCTLQVRVNEVHTQSSICLNKRDNDILGSRRVRLVCTVCTCTSTSTLLLCMAHSIHLFLSLPSSPSLPLPFHFLFLPHDLSLSLSLSCEETRDYFDDTTTATGMVRCRPMTGLQLLA